MDLRLGEDATRLLIALSLLKIRRFLDGSLRLRTACDLQLRAIRSTSPEGFELPSEADLVSAVQAGIKACSSQFANPPITMLKPSQTYLKFQNFLASESLRRVQQFST